MAGDAGIFNGRIMLRGTSCSCSTGAADTQHHRALWTMVRAPVAADTRDYSSNCCGEVSAGLVTAGTQVAFAAVEGIAWNGVEVYRSGSLQSPVETCVAGVDLVTGTAVLPRRVRIASRDQTRIRGCSGHCSGNHVAETATRVAASAACGRTAQICCTGSVPGLCPGGLLAGDQRRVVV